MGLVDTANDEGRNIPSATISSSPREKSSRKHLRTPYSKLSNVPDRLIRLPEIGRGIEGITVREMWNVYKSKLRHLDLWHRNLIKEKEKNTLTSNYKNWAGKWFIKYQNYREIGEEIERRMKESGKDEKDTVKELADIKIDTIMTIHSLVTRIRAQRGEKHFGMLNTGKNR
jgi:hypothetical protein